MRNQRFERGDEIVAIKKCDDFFDVGDEFVVGDIHKCSCGLWSLFLGFTIPRPFSFCKCECNFTISTEQFTPATYFFVKKEEWLEAQERVKTLLKTIEAPKVKELEVCNQNKIP